MTCKELMEFVAEVSDAGLSYYAAHEPSRKVAARNHANSCIECQLKLASLIARLMVIQQLPIPTLTNNINAAIREELATEEEE